MADPSAQREVIPQTQQPNLSFNSAPPISLVPQNQHPPCHYPPHVFIDPVAAAAFYQQQHRQHPAQQPLVSQPAPSNPPPHPPTPSQPQQTPVNPHAPYYMPDMAAVALQQIQLQTMLQLQAHHAHNTQHQNTHLRHENTQSSQRQPIVPHHTTATSQPNVPPVPPVPTHLTRALAANPSAIPPSLAIAPASAAQSVSLPVVPEAQMASAYRIGRYTPAERKIRLERYREKRAQRNYNRRVKYDCRKQIANNRRRVQGRFVKREEELALAASARVNGTTDGNPYNNRNSDATDATEEDTKLRQPESSGSGSSTRHVDVTLGGSSTNDPPTDQRESFCEQSDQILQTFR